jgi:hypothetical protein
MIPPSACFLNDRVLSIEFTSSLPTQNSSWVIEYEPGRGEWMESKYTIKAVGHLEPEPSLKTP